MEMFEAFLVWAIVAGVALFLVASPLGYFVVWWRMAYFGGADRSYGLSFWRYSIGCLV